MIKTISEIVTGISATVIAVVAIVGLNAWRKELSGRAIFESARKAIKPCFKILDAYIFATSIMTSSAESSERVKAVDERPEQSQVLDEWYARSKRFANVSENYNNFVEAQWELKTLLGSEATKKLDIMMNEMKSIIVELSVSISFYFDCRLREAQRGEAYNDPDFMEKNHRIVYQLDNSDSIRKLKTVVANIEVELGKYVHGIKHNKGKVS